MATRTLRDPPPAALGVIAATKLHVPTGRAELVPRDALVALVAGAPHTRLTLLSAPAGAGKTTLLTLWSRAPLEQRPFAWLSLDRSDDDPVRFWACVIEALRTVVPGTGERAGGALRSPRAGLEDIVLPLLVNDLAAWGEPAVLVLDDLHEVRDERIHASLAYLLDHLPAALHVAVATRVDPELHLARLRARDELVELRAGHLRFSDAEAGRFLKDGLGLALEPDEITVLQARTEGWAAGLQLAGLSLRARRQAGDDAPLAVTGDRLVVDYLVTEVLDGVPAGLREFLRRTSILERVCPQLAESVTGASGAAAQLRELERRNLFTAALDGEGRWFRYHPLLADALQRRLDADDPELATELHRRASAWWALHDAPAEAIAHALRAGDADGAAALVASSWNAFFNRGWLATVAGWLRALPQDRVRADPDLWLARAWTWLDVGALDELDAWLAGTAGAGDERAAWAEVLGALHRFKSGDVGAARAGVAGALAAGGVAGAGGVDTRFWRTVAELVHGVSGFWSDDAPAARAAPFEHARRLALADDNALAARYALGYLALDAIERGAVPDAAAHLAEAETLLDREPPIAEHFTAMIAALASGRLAEGEGDRERAAGHLQRAVELARRGGGRPETAAALVAHGRVLRALGDAAAAAARFAEAADVVAACPDPGRLRAELDRSHGAPPASARAATAERGQDAARDELTESELRVLRLLPSALSLREIGGELYLSLNTVKTHTRSIYAKLRVSSRDDAVLRARQLGLR